METLPAMNSFKRSPSKVWWANETNESREISASPGSQDSGFSDSETSSNNNHKIAGDIFKRTPNNNNRQNLAINYKEKSTPSKPKPPAPQRPDKTAVETAATAPAARKQRYAKHSPKSSRNLFAPRNINGGDKDEGADRYSESVAFGSSREPASNDNHDDSRSWNREGGTSDVTSTKSLVARGENESSSNDPKLSVSAPAVLVACKVHDKDHEGATSFDGSLSSDCESELECLFVGNLDSPKHTSTPKAAVGVGGSEMRQRGDGFGEGLFLKCQLDRVPPLPSVNLETENKAVEKWLEEAKTTYETECMTTLQCKSIAADLNQKVQHLAACSTTILRGILSHSNCIEMEYQNISSQPKQIKPLAQSFAGNVLDFFKTHTTEISSNVLKLCDEIRLSKSQTAPRLMANLRDRWAATRLEVIAGEVKKLVDKLEDPSSELDLRATVTGITSVALRNEELIELFAGADVVPILLILCEKCEGSSLRSLLLRALSTMCCNSGAVRRFEKFSGVQMVADTLEEDARPEPERSEAAALLAQVTAPWLEDNHSVKGLQEYSRKLVKSLTRFSSGTNCCQNLLLCAAALANLSTMDPKCVKYMIHFDTAKVLLDAVKSRGPRASVYLLEQVATLLANLSASEAARKQLTAIGAPGALLYFLRVNQLGEDVMKRLQQKSIIALSRLCGDLEASGQVVELGGVEKLVRMCREKSERFDSDAVLVAALATLRKIADTCGQEVLSAQDAQELVEPKLLDSFLAYSSQNESYV